MSVKDTSGAIALIKEWLEQRAMSEGIETTPTPSGVLFQFTGRDGTGIPFTIIQPEI